MPVTGHQLIVRSGVPSEKCLSIAIEKQNTSIIYQLLFGESQNQTEYGALFHSLSIAARWEPGWHKMRTAIRNDSIIMLGEGQSFIVTLVVFHFRCRGGSARSLCRCYPNNYGRFTVHCQEACISHRTQCWNYPFHRRAYEWEPAVVCPKRKPWMRVQTRNHMKMQPMIWDICIE